ncbi:MAG TPA: hypothetical protein DCG28_04805 [Lachnospiraceae bacterium]|nr:hypothetical protein [Lachnospiraceae bacterium]
MEESLIVLMLKNKESGFLEKELQTLSVKENDEYILNIFAVEDSGNTEIHIKLTTDNDVEDWEYSAIYDYYDTDVFKSEVICVKEDYDNYNPVWELVVPFSDSKEENEKMINKITQLHKSELQSVLQAIKDKENEYKDE